MDHDAALLARIRDIRWHGSDGYDRDDGTRVGSHQYIHAKDGPEAQALINDVLDRIRTSDVDIWRGRYQHRPHVYRYWSPADGWTYWGMGDHSIINRDHIDRAEREVAVRRRAAQ